jgi:hypothetical protein
MPPFPDNRAIFPITYLLFTENCVFLQKFEAIHNKDYSVVQTFKAGPWGLAFSLILLHNDAGSLLKDRAHNQSLAVTAQQSHKNTAHYYLIFTRDFSKFTSKLHKYNRTHFNHEKYPRP